MGRFLAKIRRIWEKNCTWALGNLIREAANPRREQKDWVGKVVAAWEVKAWRETNWIGEETDQGKRE